MAVKKSTDSVEVHWTFHPRVFTSLGAELVTNDLVAIVELVKNAYDAFARRVDIRFLIDEKSKEQIIEIQDDGHGMDQGTIMKAWFMVGTPYRANAKTVKREKALRRVTGEKGLGRLSAARLGAKLQMYTKTEGKDCYRIDVNWDTMASAPSLDECKAIMRRVTPLPGLEHHGTLLRIYQLRHKWDFDENSELPNLEAELARFVPPFHKQAGFDIYLTLPGQKETGIRIKPSRIFSHPEYTVKGKVNEKGIISITYQRHSEDKPRQITGLMYLPESEPHLYLESKFKLGEDREDTKCGGFRFEFRVWDLDRDSLLDLGRRFDLGKKVTEIRGQISDSPFSGISLYRDGILVLPKEIGGAKKQESAGRDWLGLNLRRVSRVGTRISANQVIGFVEITADANTGLRDTADRERLVDNAASRQFREFLFRIVEFLEHEREKDRTEAEHQEPPLQDLFATLRTPTISKTLVEIEKRKGTWGEIYEAVEEHTKELDQAVKEIQQRFFYYSRLASVGSLAMLLQHEVGNKVSVISELTKYLHDNLDDLSHLKYLRKRLELAENAVRSLQRLADIFSPLASRLFGTRRRKGIIEDIISTIAEWRAKEINQLHVALKFNKEERTEVAVDPGELAPILDNLMTNSLYWFRKVDVGERTIRIEVFKNSDGTRAEVRFHDSGPGIDDGYEEKIFWPGVTKKEEGIGMGLTVASELVAQHGGRMYLIKPGELGGASFGFNLPIARKGS